MSEPVSPPPGVGSVSAEDLAAAYSGPAVSCNHFILQPYANSVRIAFLEKYDLQLPSHLRAAVTIQLTDLPSLINLLNAYAKILIPSDKSTGNV